MGAIFTLAGVAIFVMNLLGGSGNLDKPICFLSGCLVGIGVGFLIIDLSNRQLKRGIKRTSDVKNPIS